MQAHIVGGGFGGLAAAAYLIRNAGVPGPDITIYEAEARLGGGFFLGGNAQSGYNLPGSVFDAEFRCTFDLLADIPSARDPSVSVKDEFFVQQTRAALVKLLRAIEAAEPAIALGRALRPFPDGCRLAFRATHPHFTTLGGRIVATIVGDHQPAGAIADRTAFNTKGRNKLLRSRVPSSIASVSMRSRSYRGCRQLSRNSWALRASPNLAAIRSGSSRDVKRNRQACTTG